MTVYCPDLLRSYSAHFVAMIIALYRLFETRNDTINIPQLVGFFENEGSFPHKEIQRFKSEIKKIKPLWIKVSGICGTELV